MKRIIIGISCENFLMATKAYKSWLKYLLDTEPGDVEDYNNYCLYVDIDSIFRYVFYDCHMDEVFGTFSDQMLYQDEFFFLEGVSQDYWKGDIYEQRRVH